MLPVTLSPITDGCNAGSHDSGREEPWNPSAIEAMGWPEFTAKDNSVHELSWHL